ncbi:MAG TPA: tetratricopeptide repeat protein [Pyrinomonadaceae bacterium]|jgi:tetratricopeptide (TPR) repeat protein
MNNKFLSASIFTILALTGGVAAQDEGAPTTQRPPAPPVRTPTPSPSPKLSETLTKTLDNLSKDEISRERREQAYSKLLEGQRYIWGMTRQRGQGVASNVRLAKQSLQKAVELNPRLAEGYTALAELALSTPPTDINEAVALAAIAVKIDKNNFGALRILSRLYTIKSGLNDGKLDEANTQKAIGAWKEIARLDPRNAEAWAFLSEYYKRTNRHDERIAALQNWQSSATPVETRFYRTVLGNQENLSPEGATAKLGEALYDAGRIPESVEVLNQAVADDPDNPQTVDLLGKVLDKADAATAATSVQTLQQAIYANPENISLVTLLAKIQARSGNSTEATKFINETVAKLAEKDKASAANLQVSLGDMYNEANRTDEAVAAYQKALTIAGIDRNNLATDNERDFAIGIFDKIIRAYKTANKFPEAKSAIEDSRAVLGEEDSFSDRQLVALYRENGKKTEALQALKAARLRFPDDYGFLRQEATVLTELGRVDEGVTIVRSLIGKNKTGVLSPMYDDFSNYLFISTLYSDAKRGKEAVDAANQAMNIAGSEERKQIAKLTLATAQQNGGDFKGAETTLRGILAESPNNPIAQNNLGYFLAERNEKLDEALKLIQEAVKSEPENPSYLDSLGWVYFKQGKLDSAEENLKKALKYDASSATIHEHLGDVYQKQGRFELAKTAWQKALTLSSDADQINAIKAKMGKKPNK